MTVRNASFEPTAAAGVAERHDVPEHRPGGHDVPRQVSAG